MRLRVRVLWIIRVRHTAVCAPNHNVAFYPSRDGCWEVVHFASVVFSDGDEAMRQFCWGIGAGTKHVQTSCKLPNVVSGGGYKLMSTYERFK